MADNPGDKAVQYFQGGYSCSESVLLALSEHFGVQSEIIPRVATGLGSGMARCGLVCGAFSGALMGLSLKFGRMRPEDDREKLYSLIKEFHRRFIAQFGDTVCPRLLGYDIGIPEEFAAARAAGVIREKCDAFVRAAANEAATLAE